MAGNNNMHVHFKTAFVNIFCFFFKTKANLIGFLLFFYFFLFEWRKEARYTDTVNEQGQARPRTATRPQARNMVLDIHLVRGDRKSFICISSSALLCHTVFPTVLCPSASKGFSCFLTSALVASSVFSTVVRQSSC